MSAYGSIWEEIRAIRVELKKAVPGGSFSTLDEARATINPLVILMLRWSELEAKAAALKDD